MKRDKMKALLEWKESIFRKPLLLNGARQVGKTWLLKELGHQHFKNTAYVNFDGNPTMSTLFDADYDLDRLLAGIQVWTGEEVIPGDTLLIFDEIQECPRALTSLKYFCEKRPDIHIAAAGSLLGITLHEGTGYPVGKVEMLDLGPLSFREFLDAVGERELRKLLDSSDASMIDTFASKFEDVLKRYYFVGGMPEAVDAYMQRGSLSDARAVQEQLLMGYKMDVSKHLHAREVEHVLAVWDSIPRHLSEENKKFIFGAIKDGARGRDYKAAVNWLSQAGLARVIKRVSKPGVPLSSYVDSGFKLFLLDIGLLGAMAGLDSKSVIEGNEIYEEFKGALTEQYVCQELSVSCGLVPYYWSAENSTGEIDFLVQVFAEVYPIEAKAEENLRAKSLRAFYDKYPTTHPLRFSMSSYREQDWMRNIPLYAVASMTLWEKSDT